MNIKMLALHRHWQDGSMGKHKHSVYIFCCVYLKMYISHLLSLWLVNFLSINCEKNWEAYKMSSCSCNIKSSWENVNCLQHFIIFNSGMNAGNHYDQLWSSLISCFSIWRTMHLRTWRPWIPLCSSGSSIYWWTMQSSSWMRLFR